MADSLQRYVYWCLAIVLTPLAASVLFLAILALFGAGLGLGSAAVEATTPRVERTLERWERHNERIGRIGQALEARDYRRDRMTLRGPEVDQYERQWRLVGATSHESVDAGVVVWVRREGQGYGPTMTHALDTEMVRGGKALPGKTLLDARQLLDQVAHIRQRDHRPEAPLSDISLTHTTIAKRGWTVDAGQRWYELTLRRSSEDYDLEAELVDAPDDAPPFAHVTLTFRLRPMTSGGR